MEGSRANILETNKTINTQKYAATLEWVKTQMKNEMETCDEANSVISSTVYSSDYKTDDEENDSSTEIESKNLTCVTEGIEQLFNTLNSTQTIGNINIEKSNGVHIGNITNINGNIQIIYHERKVKKLKKEQKEKLPLLHKKLSPSEEREKEEHNSTTLFIDVPKLKAPEKVLSIIPRHAWLAQHPTEEYMFLQEPVCKVIIAHTGTDCSKKRAINIGLVRNIQSYCIGSCDFGDIAYNFLIGCDGNIYEGRGWGIVGAHTYRYNTSSIGIAFIGTFLGELPTKAALEALKNLLRIGVENRHLTNDYKLLMHADCIATESPGRKLIEELSKWEQYDKNES